MLVVSGCTNTQPGLGEIGPSCLEDQNCGDGYICVDGECIELIQACPEYWWENAEPCVDDCSEERSYMTIGGESYYESQVDVAWVQANCDIEKEFDE